MTYITACLCAVIFTRLFTYKRGGARFRRWVSAVASLMMGACGAMVIYTMTGQIVMGWHEWPVAVLLTVVAVALLQNGGNLARLITIPNEWDGKTDRRARDGS